MKVFKVLTFTIVSLLVLVFGTAYVCRVNIFKDTNRYYFYITDVDKITEDSPIIINGKKIGNIVSIKFDYDTFRSKVIFEIDGRIRLLDHSVVNINGLDLARQKFCITITDPEGEGFYQCDIFNNGILEETYAENYYEDELSDLIIDAWHYVIDEYFEE